MTAWLRHLKAKGVGLRRVAQLSGVALRTVQAIRLGRLTCIQARTAAKLKAIQPSLAPGQVVRSYHTRQLIGALLSEGYTKRTLARRLGLHHPQVRIDPETCRVQTALKVRVLHQRLMGDESG